jgi:SAM-dependent methyltransferase
MPNYARMYRLGFSPWERYRHAAAASITALLDREETGRSRPFGRALDLGCGRRQYTPELARRGWEAVGIDNMPTASTDLERPHAAAFRCCAKTNPETEMFCPTVS